MLLVSNPYQNLSFLEFFITFFTRLTHFLLGKVPFNEIASDEVQAFVLIAIALSSALVGTFLVLQRMTMLANSLSHTILVGIVIAYFIFSGGPGAEPGLTVPIGGLLLASLVTGIFTTFLTQFLTKTGRLQEDASTGLVFTSLFALGVVLVTLLTRSAHIGTEAIMGNADALHRGDLFWVYAAVLFNWILLCLFFKEFKMTAFDPNFARALGLFPLLFNYVLMTQVSVTAITAFRAVGVLLVLAFMTGPVLTARLFTNKLLHLILLASFLGAFFALAGVALTRHILTVYGLPLSTSGVVVCVILFGYVFSILLKFLRANNLNFHAG